MAGCLVLNTKYGYLCGGVDTDATTVTTQGVKIKGIVCTSVASAATAVISEVVKGTSTAGVQAGTANRLLNWVSPVSLNEEFNMHGMRCDGLIVTIAATGTRVAIITE